MSQQSTAGEPSHGSGRALRGIILFLLGEPLAVVCAAVCIWLLIQAIAGVRALNQTDYAWQIHDYLTIGAYLAILSLAILLAVAHGAITLVASFRARQ